jgi:hypothetical protein
MVGGGGRFLDFLRFNLVPSVVLVVLGFCEDDIFSLCLSLSGTELTRKKNTDRDKVKSAKSLARSFLCVCLSVFVRLVSARARAF